MTSGALLARDSRLGTLPPPANGEARNPRPQRRVVQRDLTPAPADARDADLAKRRHDIPPLLRKREQAELEGACEDLGGRTEIGTSTSMLRRASTKRMSCFAASMLLLAVART